MSPLSINRNTDKSFIFDMISDTATIPTDEMFDIMKAASRGDDVYQTDEDCQLLEDYVAKLVGHEAGLFCTSGTLSNQLGLRSLLFQPPHSVLCDSRSHVFNYECGGIAYHSQANVVPVFAKGTYMTADEVESRINKDTLCGAITKVISLENTLNGTIMPIEEIRKIHDVARAHDIKMHLDGARLWNASEASGTPLNEYGQYFDTISLCLSKGVGAPIGSILTGPKELITRARHIRKMMGGGWRQAGMLAVAARHCINTVVPTMKETHALARKLSQHLESLGVNILLPVETNMIFIDTVRTGIIISDLAEALKVKNIKIFSNHGTTTRIVLHYQITEEAIDDFIEIATDLIQTKKKSGFVPPPLPNSVVETVEQTAEAAYPSTAI
ncbi:pyridoxal phosphate-dependent transferase [Cokeromyces recurvatus]|uniref:pyridoxal phosphate-dependent transferase n=1 Tax=Cokeromyces recurvatus TaxID=90255 RepID=UPI00221EE2D4|nr:pyridoxal phosphate-dependent transferase [Cokeromyces recurvatus]KAI7901842.1 pyridoxal phosphate-dependent transferase [Cokeromyces recurvatus]